MTALIPRLRPAAGRLALAGALALAFASAPAMAQLAAAGETAAKPARAFRLSEIVPSGTILYASIDDVPAFVESLKSTATYRLWLEPEVQAFLGDAVREVRTKIEAGREAFARETGLDSREFQSFIRGQAAIAVLPPAPAGSMPRVVASVDVGENARRIREIARGLVAKARREAGPGVEISIDSYSYGSVTVESVRANGMPFAIHSAVVGPSLLLTNDEEAMNDAIEAASGTSRRPALAADPAFGRVMSRIRGNGPSVAAYADVAAAIEAFSSRIDDEKRAVLAALGVLDARAAGLATTIGKDGVYDTFYLDAPGERRGILKLLDLPQRPFESLDVAPSDALVFAGLHADPSELWSEIRRIASAVKPGAAAEIDSALAEARAEIGFDPIADVVEAIGDEFTFVLRAPKSGPVPDMAFVARLRDAEKIKLAIGRLDEKIREHAGSGAPRHTVSTTDSGATLHSIAPEGAPFGLHFAITDDSVVIAPQASMVKATLAAGSGGLGRDTRFARALGTLDVGPDSRVGSLVYVDLENGLRYVYNLAAPFLSGWRGSKRVPIDMALLPTVDTLARHMAPIVQVMWSDQGGITTRSVSPTGNSAVIYATIGSILLGL